MSLECKPAVLDPDGGETAADGVTQRETAGLRGLLSFVLMLFVLNGFQASSCTYSCDDDDDDDDCYDDDDDDDDDDDYYVHATTGGSPNEPSVLLESYELIRAEDPDAHPARELRAIEGVSLFREGRADPIGERELESFTREILAANDELIGLPEFAGELVFDRVEFKSDGVAVHYRQQRTYVVDGTERSGRIVFWFNPLADLVAIDNQTYLF